MGDKKPDVFHASKQVHLTHLYQMCLITCGQEVHRQELCQDVMSGYTLALTGYRLGIWQDVCLPLMGPDGKCNEYWTFLLRML